MDEVTQQNSALVQQNAASAGALEEQSRAMDEKVAFFRIDQAAAGASPGVTMPRRPAAGGSAQKRAAAK